MVQARESQRQDIQNQIRAEILNILNDLCFEDHMSHYLALERQILLGGQEMKLSCKAGNHGKITICCKEDEKHRPFMDMYAAIDGKEFSFNQQISSVRDLQDKLNELVSALQKARVSFAPPYPKEFADALSEIKPGDRLDLGRCTSAVCAKKTGSKLLLKEFTDLPGGSVSYDHFKNAGTLQIDLSSKEDVQFLYGKAYNYRQNAATLYFAKASYRGADFMKDVESKLQEGETLRCATGDFCAYAVRKGGKCAWLSPFGAKYDRDTLASIYGYVRTRSASADIKKLESPGNVRGAYASTFHEEWQQAALQAVHKCIAKQDFAGVISLGKRFYKECDKAYILSFEGWKPEGNDANYKTFAFTDGAIYEMTMTTSEYGVSFPSEIKDISEAEMEQFLQNAYKNVCAMCFRNVPKSDREACLSAIIEWERRLPQNAKETDLIIQDALSEHLQE